MGLFDKGNVSIPSFASRSEAFDYLMTKLVSDGVSVEEAANRANAFAEIVAKNKKLPPAPEKPKTAIEQGVAFIQQIAVVRRDYPEVWDIVTGVVGGLIGGFAGANVATSQCSTEKEDIDFEKLT